MNGNYNARMLALRYVYILALVAWLGGMLILGAIVAPTTFQVLEATEPIAGRALAGEVFGATIARFHYVAYAAGGLLLVTLAAMAILGPRPASYALRSAVIVGMLGVALYSGLVVLPSLDVLQRGVEFDRLHTLSTRLMMLNMAAALILLYWEAKERP